jgi:hypothetical protein
MSLHMTGECLGVSRVQRGEPGNTFTVTSIHLVDRSDTGVHTHEVQLVKDFNGMLPEAGEYVVLDVFIARWESRSGNKGFDLKALGRNAALEAALEPALSSK